MALSKIYGSHNLCNAETHTLPPIICRWSSKEPYIFSSQKEAYILPKKPCFVAIFVWKWEIGHAVSATRESTHFGGPCARSHKSPILSQKSPVLSQKSPRFSQKSPILSQKSPILSQKSPRFSEKSPIFSQKSLTFSQMSPIFSQIALYSLTTPLYPLKWAPHSFRKKSTTLSQKKKEYYIVSFFWQNVVLIWEAM